MEKTLEKMSRKTGNIKIAKAKFNRSKVNDRRIIKSLASDLFVGIRGEEVRDGYNNAKHSKLSMTDWVIEYLDCKDTLLVTAVNEYFTMNPDGYVMGKLLRACWVDVDLKLAQNAFKTFNIYNKP